MQESLVQDCAPEIILDWLEVGGRGGLGEGR